MENLPWEEQPITGDGLDPASWRKCIDQYLWEGTMEADCFPELNKLQKWLVDEVKRSRSRKGKRMQPIASEEQTEGNQEGLEANQTNK